MHVRQFQDIGRDDIAEVGGKAANLGELARAGLPVPPGFVLTTAAYRRFVEVAGIQERLLELVRDLDPEDTEAADNASQAVSALFAGTEIPDDLCHELLTARAALGGTPVAVRSSATAEDLEDASFAGQQETFLHVVGEADLLEAVRGCWASLWSARALAYRARRGIDPADVALAVVIQEMAPADAAGVLFTADPATGRRTETVISAAWGLGEAVVSGMVDTDDLVVDTVRGRVLSRTTADKTVMVVPAEHGTETIPVPPERRRSPVLSDEQALDLARWGTRIAAHYGSPQDVEWALVGTGSSSPRLALSWPCRPRPGPPPRAGRCPIGAPVTSGRASSSRCPTRSPRCSRTSRQRTSSKR